MSSFEQPSDSENNPDLEALLSSLDDPGIDGEDKEGLQGFLSNMMFQLISKEVLYEPLKEMHEKVRDSPISILQQALNHVISSPATSLRTRTSCLREIRTVIKNNRKRYHRLFPSLMRRVIQMRMPRMA